MFSLRPAEQAQSISPVPLGLRFPGMSPKIRRSLMGGSNSCMRIDSAQRGKVAGTACVIGAVLLGLMGIDILTFGMPASGRTGMSGTWNPVKLRWLGTLCVIAALIIGLNARQIFRSSSPQQTLASRWSLMASGLWYAPALLGLLVFYPIPYFDHHVDKFLLFLGLLLGWGIWLLVQPASLGWSLETRLFNWLRIAVINGLLLLVLGEGLMRLTDPLLARGGLFTSSDATPGGGIPFQIMDQSGMRTNSLGFRDRERTLARSSSAPRLIALGDSFTWGAGVNYDKVFVNVVEQGLQNIVPGTEIINLGLVGSQPEEYLSLLKNHGVAYQPDMVLINFYVGNDFMPAQGSHMVVAGHRRQVHINGNWFHDHLSWDHWYLSHDLAYLWLLGHARIEQARGISDLGMWAPAKDDYGASTPAAPFPGWSPRYLRMIQGMGDQYLTQGTPAFLGRWHATREILEQIDVLLRERGIPWTLILLPAEEQVDQELQRLYVEMRGGVPEDYEFLKPQRLLLEWGRERGVKVVDLTPGFLVHIAERRHYVDNDIHWNVNGNALAAQMILRELRPQVENIAGVTIH